LHHYHRASAKGLLRTITLEHYYNNPPVDKHYCIASLPYCSVAQSAARLPWCSTAGGSSMSRLKRL
jgi:hypothetical protein